jgi:hypothetical protein
MNSEPADWSNLKFALERLHDDNEITTFLANFFYFWKIDFVNFKSCFEKKTANRLTKRKEQRRRH